MYNAHKPAAKYIDKSNFSNKMEMIGKTIM